MLEETLKLRKSKLPKDHPDTLATRSNLVAAYQQSGDETRAEPLLRGMLEFQEKKDGVEHPAVAGAMASLGLCLLKQGKCAEAEPILRRCLAIRAAKLPDDWSRFDAMSLLGVSLLAQKKYVEAEPLLLNGYAGMKAREAKMPAQNKAGLTDVAGRIVALYNAWGKPDEAAAWRARLGLPARLHALPADVFAPPAAVGTVGP